MQYRKVLFILYLVASTHALNCPEGPGFSNCNNTVSHRLQKRDIEEIHSIDVRMTKEKIVQAYQEINPVIDNLVADVAPSIHEKFSTTYLPALRSLKNDVMPFFRAKVYPQVQKYYKFALNIAEKFIDKTYRSYKLSNSTHLVVFSVSDLIGEIYNELQPILQTGKYLATWMMFNNGHSTGKSHATKKFVEVPEEVHIIDIQELKIKLTETYQEVKPVLKDLASEIAPSVYEKFAVTYLPKLQKIKRDILPFVQSKVFPQIKKYVKFASSVVEKVVDKAYRSYHLSNSTHINIVSVSDIVEEVYTEMKPILNLAKYLSMRMSMRSSHYRGKRDLSGVTESELVRHKRQVPSFFPDMMIPFRNFIHSIISPLLGGPDSLKSKVLLPLFLDVLADPESRNDLFNVFVIAKSAFSPLLREMMRNQMHNTAEGTIVRIPRSLYEKALNDWQRARLPVERLLNKHTKSFFWYMHEATPQVSDFFKYLMYEGYNGVDVLKDQYFTFIHKHRSLFRSSTNDYVHYYPLSEIKSDLKPLMTSAMNIVVQYARRNPHSLFNMFFVENSFFQELFNMPMFG